jgi:hypothetical protein
MDQFTEFVGGC